MSCDEVNFLHTRTHAINSLHEVLTVLFTETVIHTNCVLQHMFLWQHLTFYAMCHTYKHILCVTYHTHTRCKLIPPHLFSTTICLYGISYNSFDAESLLTIHTHNILNAIAGFYSLFPFSAGHMIFNFMQYTHTHTHPLRKMHIYLMSRSLAQPFLHCKNCYSLEHTTRSFPSRNIAFGSCICFEEQFLSCDSLRPIRT